MESKLTPTLGYHKTPLICSHLLKGITESIVRQLVEFAYTGHITIGKDTVKEMLQGAGCLKFLPVRDACTDFLERHISPSNSVGIRYFALLEVRD